MKKAVELKVDEFLRDEVELRIDELMQIGIRNVEDFVNLKATRLPKSSEDPETALWAFGDPEDPTFVLKLKYKVTTRVKEPKARKSEEENV